MAYTPTNWKDRVVEKPRTYRMQENGDGTITLIPEPGTIYEPGTPVNAPNLNKMEQGIKTAHDIAETAQTTANTAKTRADAALLKDGSEAMTGPLRVNGNGGISAYSWLTMSSAGGGEAVLSDNAYIDTNTNQLKYKNTHPSLGARGIVFDWGSPGAPKFFDTGNVPATANQVFTPTRYDLWHTGLLRWNASGYLEYNDGGTWRPVGGIKSIQRGTASISGSSGTYTDVVISAVDINKSFAHLNVIGNFASSIPWQITAKLINSTTLRLTFYHSAGGPATANNLEWEVVEFY